MVIIVGGARRTRTEWHSEQQIRDAHPQRALPVVYEEAPAAKDRPSSGSTGESPKRA